MELKHINGRKLIELLNSKDEEIEDLKDETLYYKFEYEKQYIKDNQYVLEFTIDNDYYIKGNRIWIESNGTVDSRIEEPYDSGSQYEEIESIVKVYLKQLEVDIRDNKIAIALDEEIDERSRLKASITTMINELNDIIISDEISEEDEDDLLTLTDLEADLNAALSKVLDKI
jgi:hypothetical protein